MRRPHIAQFRQMHSTLCNNPIFTAFLTPKFSVWSSPNLGRVQTSRNYSADNMRLIAGRPWEGTHRKILVRVPMGTNAGTWAQREAGISVPDIAWQMQLPSTNSRRGSPSFRGNLFGSTTIAARKTSSEDRKTVVRVTFEWHV